MSETRYGDANIKTKIWNNYFNKSVGKDAFGHYIKYEEYGKRSKFSWTIDHIWPRKPFKAKRKGSDYFKNLQPLCTRCNVEKQGLLSKEIDGHYFSIEPAGERKSSNGEVRMIGRMIVDDKIASPF